MTFLYFILGYFGFGLIYSGLTFSPLARASIYAAMKSQQLTTDPNDLFWREPEAHEVVGGFIITFVVTVFKIFAFPFFFFVDPFIWIQSRKIKRKAKMYKELASV
ncbi:hypothetical protein [Terribacillus saccharophilus]|uniref:Uncharacterized protein n=1 Tax=Terribacillus saccharophilus TaxID=361277 RepID=A0ABX4GTD6_9BACI|nr:hypothetical protein [Terribacillus saccharophilus]PAD94374.1 hypothetical protein CHH50_18820 [Terribacillus saccharophilus]PAD98122.1 hypothetical protein CHH48_18935 [Terribacillus saccharophilus]